MVRAYVAAADLEPGAYNVCSGRTATVRDLIAMVSEAATHAGPPRGRPGARARARRARGAWLGRAARAATGWKPEIPLARTVADALDAWRAELRTTD